MSTKTSTLDIQKYYSKNSEDLRHLQQQLEFGICSQLLHQYLQNKTLNILEVGAGAGYYTELLAKMGHSVTVVEPVQALNQVSQRNLKTQSLDKNVIWIEADARDLNSEKLKGQSFELILNMGPMYHLFESKEHRSVLNQLKSLLKPEGLLMSVFLSRVGFVSYLLSRQPEALLNDPEGFRDVLTVGFNKGHPQDGTFRGYFTNLQELATLHDQCGLQIAKIHVLDPCVGGTDEIFNRLTGDMKKAWLEVLCALSADPSFWNSGRTWMVVSNKSG